MWSYFRTLFPKHTFLQCPTISHPKCREFFITTLATCDAAEEASNRLGAIQNLIVLVNPLLSRFFFFVIKYFNYIQTKLSECTLSGTTNCYLIVSTNTYSLIQALELINKQQWHYVSTPDFIILRMYLSIVQRIAVCTEDVMSFLKASDP